MDVDEDYIQVKTLSDNVANTIVEALKKRFTRFDYYEKSVIISSTMKVFMCVLLCLNPYERKAAVLTLLASIDRLLSDQYE